MILNLPPTRRPRLPGEARVDHLSHPLPRFPECTLSPMRALLLPLVLLLAPVPLLLAAGSARAGLIESHVEVPLPELLGEYIGGPGLKQTEWDAGVEFSRLSSVWVVFQIDDRPDGDCTTSIPRECTGPYFRMRFDGEERGAEFVRRDGFLVHGDLSALADGRGQIEFEYGVAITVGDELQGYTQTDPGTVRSMRLFLTGVIVPEPAAVGMVVGAIGVMVGVRRRRAQYGVPSFR